MVEQIPSKDKVIGSSPIRGATKDWSSSMANFKRRKQKKKDAVDSQGYSSSCIPASYDSEKYMNRQEQRLKAKEKEELQNGTQVDGQEGL